MSRSSRLATRAARHASHATPAVAEPAPRAGRDAARTTRTTRGDTPQTTTRALARAILAISECGVTMGEAFSRFLDAGLRSARATVLGTPADLPTGTDAGADAGASAEARLARAEAEAVARYVDAVRAAPPFFDVLGPVYETLGAEGHKQYLGQFFTPWPVARMMAEMQLGGAPPTGDASAGGEERECTPEMARAKPGGGLWRLGDPACGAGVMLLAGLSTLRERYGDAVLRHWSVTGIDIDRMCARMTALQLIAGCAYHGLVVGELLVLHGDGLQIKGTPTVLMHATAASTEAPDAEALDAEGSGVQSAPHAPGASVATRHQAATGRDGATSAPAAAVTDGDDAAGSATTEATSETPRTTPSTTRRGQKRPTAQLAFW